MTYCEVPQKLDDAEIIHFRVLSLQPENNLTTIVNFVCQVANLASYEIAIYGVENETEIKSGHSIQYSYLLHMNQ